MSKYDLFFAAVDESDGQKYKTYLGFSFTTNATATITRDTITLSSAGATGSARAGQFLTSIVGATVVLQLVEDCNAGDTTMKVKFVESSTNTLGIGGTIPSGMLCFSLGGAVVDLAIDLRNAPTGKYNYVIGGHVGVQSDNASSQLCGQQLVVTDDLSHDPREAPSSYAQGKASTKIVSKSGSTNSIMPLSSFITAELDSGKIHWVRMFCDGGFLQPVKAHNPRLFAMRYIPELSTVIAGDGTGDEASDSTGDVGHSFSSAQISALDNSSTYAFVANIAGGFTEFASSGLNVRTDGDLKVALTAANSDAWSTGELIPMAGFIPATGAQVKNNTSDLISVGGTSIGSPGVRTWKNVLFGAFYCPAIQATSTTFYDNQNMPEVLSTSYQTLTSSAFADIKKQQQAFMLTTISPNIASVTGSATEWSMRSVYPSSSGTARDEFRVPVGQRTQAISPFHVDEVPRGNLAIGLEIKGDAATTATVGAFYSAPALCIATDKGRYEYGTKKETLVELETEIVTTNWNQSGDLWVCVVDSDMGTFDDISSLSVNGVAQSRYDGSSAFSVNSGQYLVIATGGGGITLWAYPQSGAPDLDDPSVAVAVGVPLRFSLLGTDVKKYTPSLTAGAGKLEYYPYPARLVSSPSIRRSQDAGVSIGAISLDNADGELDAALVTRAWTGRRARVYVGDPDKSDVLDDFDLVFDGEMDSPSVASEKLTVKLKATSLALTSPLDLGDVTAYVGKADSNEYTQATKLPVIYGDVLRAKAVRVSDNSGSSARYAAMFGKQSFTPSKVYLNSSDPDVAFTVPTNNDNSDLQVADSVIPGGASTDRLEQVYTDGRGLDFDHAGEICLDILSRFSKVPTEQINVSSFEDIDRDTILKLKAGNQRSRGDSAKMGVVLDASTTVEEALRKVLETVGAKLIVPSDGKLTAAFSNYAHDNQLRVLPAEAKSWCTFNNTTGALVEAHPGFAGIPFATKFKVQSGVAATASGDVHFESGGTHLFEAVAVAGSFNNPNDLKVEMTLPGEVARTQLWHQAVKIDTGYPVANTWDWTLISALVEPKEGHCGSGTIYVSPRTSSAANEIDVYLDQTRLVRVHKVDDGNATVASMQISPAQYSQVASKFNVNPLREDAAPTAVADMNPASALPVEASNNRFTLPGHMSDAESALGVATYAAGSKGVQQVRATFTVQGLDRPPRAGEYLHVDMSRVPTFNYPSKLWRIAEANQKKANIGVYDIVAYRESIARYGIFS